MLQCLQRDSTSNLWTLRASFGCQLIRYRIPAQLEPRTYIDDHLEPFIIQLIVLLTIRLV